MSEAAFDFMTAVKALKSLNTEEVAVCILFSAHDYAQFHDQSSRYMMRSVPFTSLAGVPIQVVDRLHRSVVVFVDGTTLAVSQLKA